MRSLAKALVFCLVAFSVALASRVLIPYYQKQHDAPAKTESGERVRKIMGAINHFADTNPDRRFPTNLAEVVSLAGIDTTRFVYLAPPAHASQKELFGRVVLLEKLGHYKYKDGGYGGKAGSITPFWCPGRDYETLAAKNGLSMGQLSEAQNKER